MSRSLGLVCRLLSRWVVLGAIVLMVPACAIRAPNQPVNQCAFKSYSLDVDQPDDTLLQPDGSPFVAGPSGRAPVERNPVPTRQIASQVLILSGGSEHGAFGAGFLDEWRQNRADRRLPEFDQVTGVSTGAILATFAFVGDEATARAVRGYRITRESDLLHPFVAVKNGQPTTLSYINLLRKGALADLGPLSALLHRDGVIDDGLLEQVYARGYREGRQVRHLLVGVVDVDTGRARALDLTDMARQYHELAAADPRKAVKRDCYIDAIVASSSAPLAARPVFIDNREYIDGGARFGMFYLDTSSNDPDDYRARPLAMGQNAAEFDATMRALGTVYIIVNGDQHVVYQCGEAAQTDCTPAEADRYARPSTHPGQHKDWKFLDLALRSEDILTNQVYRFSAAYAQGKSAQSDHEAIKFARIISWGKRDRLDAFNPFDHRDVLRAVDPFLDLDPHKTCNDWRDYDRKTTDPLQFYPYEMHCTIEYGRYMYLIGKASWDAAPR